jgi:hypothetical protein
LLVHRELKHTKEKILELFFGDLSASSADNVFHQAITNIRGVVKPEINFPETKEKSSRKQKQINKQKLTQRLIFSL